MSKAMPPIPPASRTPHDGTPSLTNADPKTYGTGVPENQKEQGQAGNIHQNTHHQGYQQDR